MSSSVTSLFLRSACAERFDERERALR